MHLGVDDRRAVGGEKFKFEKQKWEIGFWEQKKFS